jgi:hypothetical protein
MPKRYYITDDDIDLETQEWLFDEGLVKMVVYPRGLDVEITDAGMELLKQTDAVPDTLIVSKIKFKPRRYMSGFRVWLMLAVFILSAIVCFLL